MLRPLLAGLFLVTAIPAQAALLTESFDAPYAGWETRWFAQNSNAARVFFNPDDRGNNTTGLTIFDGNPFDGGQVRIFFDAAFGRTIRNFSFDILGYNQQTLDVFDSDGNSLLNVVIEAVAGPPFDFADANYTRFSVNSSNGIGGFSLLPFGAEYNFSIDDLSVTTVPEPATWALLIGGFGLVGASLRRRRIQYS